MSNEQKTPESRDYRTGYGQTAYKRQLGYQRLGIDPKDVECAPFFRANLKNIGRCVVASAYLSVPESYRKLIAPEAYCQVAGVATSRVLELIAGIAVSQGVQASTVVAAIWHPRVVEKTIERALHDDGQKDRLIIHKAMGFVPSGGSTSIRERLVP